MKIGRNNPCPCGSGKKYKHCCLSPATAVSDDLQELMAEQEFNSLEQAQAFTDTFMQQRNQQPQDDFEGLSPEQVHRMLHFPFDTPAFFEFPETLALQTEAPVLELIRSITDAIDEKGLKATAKGNLPRKLCQAAAASYWSEFPEDDIHHQIRVNKEEDCADLHIARVLMEFAGLLRNTKGRFYLTRKYYQMTTTQSGLTGLYPTILKTCCTDFNWAYRDGYEEIPFIQQSFLFTLYLLHRHGNDWKPCRFYEDRFVQAFPMICDEVEPTTYYTAEEHIRSCYSLRVLHRFVHFMGLARVEKVPGSKLFSREYQIVKLPLLDEVTRFNI
jgi:hypothetical protein